VSLAQCASLEIIEATGEAKPDPRRLTTVDFVEERPVAAPVLWICGAVSEADSCLFASNGEDRRRERNELRQLSQILGCGG
jgi:hypothetical protein